MSKKDKKKILFNENEDAFREDAAPLSDEELKMLASSRPELDRATLPHYDNSDIALAKRYAKKNKFTVIFVTLTILLVIAVIAVLSILLYNTLADAPSKDDVVITLGDDETTVKYKKAMIDGVLYLDIVPIAKYAGLVVSGDEHSLKISCEDGTFVRFDSGKSIATVNDEKVKLGGEAMISYADTKSNSDQKIECRVPFDFIKDLFSYEVEKDTPSIYVSFSQKTNEVIFHKITYKSSGKPLPVSFSADCFDVIAN